jgi:S-disulfanyl-L-cysteine oxidoreductase SoxD
MFKWAEQACVRYRAWMLAALAVTFSAVTTAADRFPGIGRAATSAEISAWDIDVRPDFKGLPTGSGSVADGQAIWDARCASCHGTFGESNEIFTPIIGGTTKEDIERGRVASLSDTKQPQRTTMMKVATLSSLFDYIYRAMPWNEPRSLTVNETYAVLAHVLNLAEIVPDDFTLSNQNVVSVQSRMPNRFGMTNAHGLANARGKPDIQAPACMKDCAEFVQIGSRLPDYARNAHNNLAEQNRPWGPFRGADTTVAPLSALPAGLSVAFRQAASPVAQTNSVSPAPTGKVGKTLFAKHHCSACHGVNNKLVGPSLSEIAKRYQGKPETATMLQKKVELGGAGAWGNIPMPPHATIAASDIASLVSWILEGKF